MNKFAFFIHPLDMRDLIRFEPKVAGKRRELVEKVLEWLPPYKASHITGVRSLTGEEIEGYFIAVPLLPNQYLSLPEEMLMEKLVAGGKIAEELGCQILGLGGFTAVVGNGGYKLARRLDIPVTSGNTYTIATALQGTEITARRLGINLPYRKAAVIGATGAIGRVCSQVLAPKVKKLTLIARNEPRLKFLAQEIKDDFGFEPEITTDLTQGLKDAELIISATSSTGSLITPEMIPFGAVICDVSLPHDVVRDVATRRKDVMVIEGGLVEVPGNPEFNSNFGYPPGIALACMAETMILTLEGRFEPYSIGRKIKLEKVAEIEGMALKHGFKLAGLRSFDLPVTDEVIERVKAAREKGTDPA